MQLENRSIDGCDHDDDDDRSNHDAHAYPHDKEAKYFRLPVESSQPAINLNPYLEDRTADHHNYCDDLHNSNHRL